MQGRESESRLPEPGSFVEEFWDWVAVALFLLISVDLLTTIFAVKVVGISFESNPVMRSLLVKSTPVIIGVHLAAVLLAVLFFYGLKTVLVQAPPKYKKTIKVLTELYLGLLVGVGLFVLANNLSVIVLGGSLL